MIDLGNHGSIVLCTCGQGHRYQHHLVPVFTLALVLVHRSNQITDVIEGIGILHACRVLVVRSRIGSAVVCQLVLLEEGIQTVFLYHQDSRRNTELIVVVVIYIIHSWERDGSCIQRILLMTLHDILYWQRYFCEDAGW